MQVVIFASEADGNTQNVMDLVLWLSTHTDEPYATQTTRWAIPRLMLDGNWSYKVCPTQNYGGLTVQEYNRADYAAE